MEMEIGKEIGKEGERKSIDIQQPVDEHLDTAPEPPQRTAMPPEQQRQLWRNAYSE
jgi:hypothetical protein